MSDEERFDILNSPGWFEDGRHITPADINIIDRAPYAYGGVPEQKDVPGYTVNASGDMQQWDTGAVRDSQDGKPRYDLIDPEFLFRMAEVMRKGADHYGEFNWTQGIPTQRYMASLLRHVFAYYNGDNSEDHLAAAAFNLMGIMRNEGTDLDDLFQW